MYVHGLPRACVLRFPLQAHGARRPGSPCRSHAWWPLRLIEHSGRKLVGFARSEHHRPLLFCRFALLGFSEIPKAHHLSSKLDFQVYY